MDQESPMNEVMKWADIVGMSANKAQKRQRCEKWAQKTLNKILMKKWVGIAETSARKSTG